MSIFYSFLITIIAGFSTLIGFIIILFNFKDSKKIINISLSFSSGVMFCISVFDLFIESIKLFNIENNIFISIILFFISFFIGIIITYLINKFLPENNNLYKIGLISMIGIMLHNIPEGIITFLMSSANKKIGISIAFAIAMHNIPEGISIAVPIYHSTKNKKKTFLYVLISALSEPLGALIAYLFMQNMMTYLFMGILLSIVCGIMIYISLFELLKEARMYNKNLSYIVFLIGIVFMLINLIVM